MVYYVVYKAAKNYSNRGLIPAGLRALGCKQINKTFWEFEKEKTYKVLRLLEKNQPVILKRIKEVRKRSIIHGKIQDLGSLIVVTFKAPREKRETIRGFAKKAPCIRLCRRAYAFYQRHQTFDSENKLIDAQGLAAFIKELNGEVRLIPKIVALNEQSTQRLVDETKQHMEREILGIIQKSKQVYDKRLRNECSNVKLSETLRRLRAQYVRIKRKAGFYSAWMAVDLSRDVIKAYKALLKLRHLSR
jgi:hypothetical protein